MAKPSPRTNGDARYVSARTLSDHLDLGTTYIRKLESEGVLQRTPQGFHLDRARVAYIQHLRRERRQSPQHAAAADLAAAKAQLLRLRVAEKEQSLMPIQEHEATLDAAVGITLTVMAGLAARIFTTAAELPARRRAERIILDARREIADRCLKRAELLRAEAQANGYNGALSKDPGAF